MFFFPFERLDNTLEEIIFKLVPGLRERKFLIWFWVLVWVDGGNMTISNDKPVVLILKFILLFFDVN